MLHHYAVIMQFGSLGSEYTCFSGCHLLLDPSLSEISQGAVLRKERSFPLVETCCHDSPCPASDTSDMDMSS